MTYYLHDGHSVSPPRTEADLREALKDGRLPPDRLCTQQGWTEWKPLSQVFPDAEIGISKAPPKTLRLSPAPAAAAREPATAPPPNPASAQPADAPPLLSAHAPTSVRPKRRWVLETIKLLFVTGCGLCTALALGALLAGFELITGWALYSITFWFVLPVGALLTGVGAGGGSFYAARWVHYYPRFLFFVSSVVIAVGTLAAIHFMVWSQTVIDGAPLRESLSYQDYLTWVSHHSSITTKHNTSKPIELGETASLAYFAIQALGFFFGGICLFGILRNQPYCHESGTYKRRVRVVERYERDPLVMEEQVRIIKALLADGRHAEAIARHPFRESLAKRGHAEGARSVVTFYKSDKSSVTTLRHQVFVCARKNEWNEIDALTADYETASV